MTKIKIPRPGEPEEEEKTKTEPEEDYSREIKEVESNITGLKTEVKDLSERLSELAEKEGIKEVLSECPECKRMVKPENMGEHLLNELKPKIREELKPKIREELKEKLKPEVKVKGVPKLIPQAKFRKIITDELDEYRKDEVDELKPGILEAEKILLESGLIESEGEE